MRHDPRPEILNEPVAKHLERDIAVVLDEFTIEEAMALLSSQPPDGPLFYIYVLNHHRQLVGVLPTRALIINPPATPIKSLMKPSVVTISADATVLEACEFFIQHRYLALPVVDSQRRILGVVNVNLFTDEVLDLAERQTRDDVFQLIGIHVWKTQRVAPWTNFRDRFPWLVANLVGGTICALLTSRFEGLLTAVIAVAMFVPIVLTLSESVSIQSMTILLQGLHGSRVDWRFLAVALAREAVAATLLGLASGGAVGLVCWLWLRLGWLAVAVALSLTLSVLSASLLGLALPIAIRAARADPRIAAGPIVLATTDVVTLLVYFAISTRLLL